MIRIFITKDHQEDMCVSKISNRCDLVPGISNVPPSDNLKIRKSERDQLYQKYSFANLIQYQEYCFSRELGSVENESFRFEKGGTYVLAIPQSRCSH